eukprot:scaffold315892_cov22-Tisochrysis_lutea.AAC.2
MSPSSITAQAPSITSRERGVRYDRPTSQYPFCDQINSGNEQGLFLPMACQANTRGQKRLLVFPSQPFPFGFIQLLIKNQSSAHGCKCMCLSFFFLSGAPVMGREQGCENTPPKGNLRQILSPQVCLLARTGKIGCDLFIHSSTSLSVDLETPHPLTRALPMAAKLLARVAGV